MGKFTADNSKYAGRAKDQYSPGPGKHQPPATVHGRTKTADATHPSLKKPAK